MSAYDETHERIRRMIPESLRPVFDAAYTDNGESGIGDDDHHTVVEYDYTVQLPNGYAWCTSFGFEYIHHPDPTPEFTIGDVIALEGGDVRVVGVGVQPESGSEDGGRPVTFISVSIGEVEASRES